jgi:hypothetical protein
MLRRKIGYLVALGFVLVFAYEAAGWPRLHRHRCTCPSEERSSVAASTSAPSAEGARLLRMEAEKAKTALLRLIRSDREFFVGNPDPDRLEGIPLSFDDLQEPQKFSWGAFVIDVKQRTYHADIVAEGVAAWFYSGTFQVDASGQWTAGKPKVQHAQAVPNHK